MLGALTKPFLFFCLVISTYQVQNIYHYNPDAMGKHIFVFTDELLVDLMDSSYEPVFHLAFYNQKQGKVVTSSVEEDDSTFCPTDHWYGNRKIWQARNVGSLWYKEESYYFTINNMAGNYTRGCGIKTSSSIRQMQIRNVDVLQAMMFCTSR